MKNYIKVSIISFILGAIIFGSVGVLASQIFARDIKYGNTNVESALNDLYSNIISGEKLYEESLYDTSSLSIKSYEFSEDKFAILYASASHGNNSSSYNHQLNTPNVVNGEIIKLYSIGPLDSNVTGGQVLSEYLYLVKAHNGTKIEISGKAYGYGNYRIKIFG